MYYISILQSSLYLYFTCAFVAQTMVCVQRWASRGGPDPSHFAMGIQMCTDPQFAAVLLYIPVMHSIALLLLPLPHGHLSLTVC